MMESKFMRTKSSTTTRIIGRCFKRTSAAFAVIALLSMPHLQEARIATPYPQSGDERVQRVIASLEGDNTLRIALERGDRGSGVHRSWMDTMRRFGVKHASYKIRFVWGPVFRRLSIQGTSYLTHYYRFDSK